jgi:hypothetical protein
MEPIAITLGGEAVAIPPVMNFAQLKRAWPGIRALGEAADMVDRVSASIRILAAALGRVRPELTAEEIEERLRPGEMAGLMAALPFLLEASGLVPSGEAGPRATPGDTTNSTAISTGSPPA